MSRAGLVRTAIVVAAVAALELAARGGLLRAGVAVPPSEVAAKLWSILRAGDANADLAETLGNVALACGLALVAGFSLGAVVHGLPRLRRALDPFLASYYALPFFAFYPVLIVVLGIGRLPIVAIGFMFAVVAMMVATLNGFDRIPRALPRTARVWRMGPVRTALKIKLPSAAPHLFTGIKLAVAYAFIGVIAAEFIMATSGLGYAIAYAFNNYDNRTMYALMLLLLGIVVVVNGVLHGAEQRLLARRRAR
ncbi:ABC transporter permease subunit [Rhodoplanes serenus]|jgi:NitT/TauT family transport system permease protein|uniref:ABC transporter permease subunit n=1 Tax=Rhodoplanes serenus TaxID=200615 RepID=A0A9X5ASW4_9BRAD|nr:ABC transporter permease subunit [Rhodoplanes serenus]MTW16428.1 ABC transporter permease subunit [Rhodoplanes serenus]